MLGEKLRRLREAKGLVQRQIASAIEVDTAFISKVENEEKILSRFHLPKLSIILGIEEEELLSLWLAEKILNLTKDEKLAEVAIRKALEEMKKRRSKLPTNL